jgi:hypothetical protein
MIPAEMWRWLLPIAILLVVVLSALAVRHFSQERAQQRREVDYQSALRSYSVILTPGMTRKELEDYLRAKDVKFHQMCCVEQSKRFSANVYDDLVKIGQEDAPWFCSEKNVYVAFQFVGPPKNGPGPAADGSDRLRAISIYRSLEGCL